MIPRCSPPWCADVLSLIFALILNWFLHSYFSLYTELSFLLLLEFFFLFFHFFVALLFCLSFLSCFCTCLFLRTILIPKGWIDVGDERTRLMCWAARGCKGFDECRWREEGMMFLWSLWKKASLGNVQLSYYYWSHSINSFDVCQNLEAQIIWGLKKKWNFIN